MLVKQETEWHCTLIYRSRVHRSCKCSNSMFMVAGVTWWVWLWIKILNYYLLWSEYHLNLQWSSSETENQAHWDPYALHQIACAWWYHCSTRLCIFRTSSRHLHLFFLRIPSAISNHCWGFLIMLWSMIDENISKFCFSCPCLREDFSTGFFPLSLVVWTSNM